MKYFKANVSLTVVLVTSAVLLIGSITIILNVIDMTKTNKDNVMYELNTIRADSCLEESMNRLKFNPNFEGSVSITFEDGSCESIISIDLVNNDLRLLEISSVINEYHYQISKQVDMLQTPFYVFN